MWTTWPRVLASVPSKSKTSLVSDATTDDQSSDDIIGDPSESDGIAVTWVKRIGGRRYANEDTTVFDSLWVGKGKASGIKPRRKNSEPKESPSNTCRPPYRHHSILHPPAQLSRSPPSPKSPSLSCHGGSNPLFILCSPIHLKFTSSTHPTLRATQPGQLHQRFHPAKSHRFIVGAPSSSTAVESGNVTAWNVRSIRFSLADTMLDWKIGSGG